MRLGHKLVSIGMLAILALLPLVPVLAVCSPQTAESSMHCPEGCPMMAKQTSQDRVSQVKVDRSESCCKIERSTPAPEKAATVVVPVVSVEPATTSVVVVATSHSEPPVVTDSSPPPFADSQAQLCTFLI